MMNPEVFNTLDDEQKVALINEVIRLKTHNSFSKQLLVEMIRWISEHIDMLEGLGDDDRADRE